MNLVMTRIMGSEGPVVPRSVTRISNECLVEPMPSNIEAVLFDLDGTLLDRRRSFEQFTRNQRERFAYCLQAVGGGGFAMEPS